MVNVPELIIFNVGHGNCAVLRDTKAITVIDCGYKGTDLVEMLIRLNVNAVDHVIISHADRDHSGGLRPLLEAFPVHHLYLNAEMCACAVRSRYQSSHESATTRHQFLWRNDSHPHRWSANYL
jgi:beta-lactamase superfamily II metal-dependent hydrolase